MKLTLELTPDQVQSLARVLNARARGATANLVDLSVFETIATHLVNQAAITHALNTPEIAAVFAREFHQFDRVRATHRLPRSKRTPGPGA